MTIGKYQIRNTKGGLSFCGVESTHSSKTELKEARWIYGEIFEMIFGPVKGTHFLGNLDFHKVWSLGLLQGRREREVDLETGGDGGSL